MARLALIAVLAAGLTTAACGGHRRDACAAKDGKAAATAPVAPLAAPTEAAPGSG